MRKVYASILCLVFSVLFPAYTLAQPSEHITCTVRVVDYMARPVAGAEVAACEKVYDYSAGRIRTELLGEIKKTNPEGLVVMDIAFDKRRDVYIIARKAGLALGWDRFEPEINIILGRPFVLAGTVVDEDGSSIGSALVRVVPSWKCIDRLRNIHPDEPEDWLTTEADANGKFSFDNIGADVTADFSVESPGKASSYTFPTSLGMPGWKYAAGQRDIVITLVPEARIEGRTVDADGNGIDGVTLLARPDNRSANYYCPPTVTSEKGGRFCFKGLSAGTYTLQMVTSREESDKWIAKDVNLTTTTGETTKDITIKVAKGASLEVLVRDAASEVPIHNALVIVRQDSLLCRHYSFYKNAKTDHNGLIQTRVPLGQCNILASGNGYLYFRGDHMVEAEQSKMEILLDPKPKVSGVVRDEMGRAAAGAIVRVWPAINGESATTDKGGRFELNYQVRSEQRYIFARHRQRNLAALAELTDDSKPVNITLKSALVFAGRVTDPAGNPIPAVMVRCRASIPGWIVDVGEEVITNADGSYEISAVPPPQEDVSYYIKILASGYGPVESKDVVPEGATEGQIKVAPFVLPPANLSISGIIVDADSKAVADVPIILTGLRGNASQGQPTRYTVSDADGKFSINRVCKGPLWLQAGMGGSDNEPGFLDAEGGDTGLKVIMGQNLVHTHHVSLTGKVLLDLDAFGIELKPEHVKDKAILVCFWDMQQRPSRYYIRELGRKAEELKANNVTVVAIQASKVDQNALKAWLKKYNISFTIGTIEEDVEKVQLEWGVKALPWLILADKEHIVRAEGFSLNELSEKVKQISGE
jgi:protocatechuate 3,4-dioxygenase beta subunit